MAVNVWDAVRLPFDTIKRAYRQLRKVLFTAERPSGRYLVVDATVADLEATLGVQSYAPNWEFSYHERGEILNLARVVYEEATAEGTTYRWWQTHVRGWDHPDGVALHGHWELEPTENGNDHLDGTGYDPDRGTENLEEALRRADVPYAEVEIDPEG